MRAEITRAHLGKAILNLRKIQEQRKLRFRREPAAGNRVKKIRFPELNLELEPVAGFLPTGPARAPADQGVRPGPKIKVCLRASWFGPLDQGPEGICGTICFFRDLDSLGTESEQNRGADELFRTGKTRSGPTDGDCSIARFRKSNGIALLFQDSVNQIHRRIAKELRHK